MFLWLTALHVSLLSISGWKGSVAFIEGPFAGYDWQLFVWTLTCSRPKTTRQVFVSYVNAIMDLL